MIVTFSTKRFVLSWREWLDRLSYANNPSGKRRHCNFHSKYHLQLFLDELRSDFVFLFDKSGPTAPTIYASPRRVQDCARRRDFLRLVHLVHAFEPFICLVTKDLLCNLGLEDIINLHISVLRFCMIRREWRPYTKFRVLAKKLSVGNSQVALSPFWPFTESNRKIVWHAIKQCT